MTEPMPSGGSDSSMILTKAEKRGDKYVISGRKWFITGAEEVQHFILIARIANETCKGLTALLFDRDQPAGASSGASKSWGRRSTTVVLDGLEISTSAVLMNEGGGLKATQIRLGPARVTHCMRWPRLSKGCVEIARAHAAERTGFGIRLADRESIQMMLGELAMKIEIGRLLAMKAACARDLVCLSDSVSGELSLTAIRRSLNRRYPSARRP